MSPNEAADLLGVAPAATADDIQRAYEAKLYEAGGDVQRRDAVTAARDALLAASAWQAPAQHPGYAPPNASAPAGPYPAGPWYPAPPPARRGLSTGAVVGITLGSIAAAFAILVVVFVALFAVAHESSRLAGSDVGSSAAPFDDPSDEPFDDPSDGGDDASAQDYDIDGVHVHNVDGWTFELTADQTCTGAQITAGFSDSPDGDDLDQWTTIVDLEAGVPLTVTIPDSASDYDYAGIETIDCTQT